MMQTLKTGRTVLLESDTPKGWLRNFHVRQARKPRINSVCHASAEDVKFPLQFSRRNLLALLATAPAVLQTPLSLAEGDPLETYTDASDQFSISLPKGWLSAQGQTEGNSSFSGASGVRRALAWFPEGTPDDLNVSLVVTNVGADYTSLGSFGNPYDFGSNLVASMDRSYLERVPAYARARETKDGVQKARLIDAKKLRNMYLVEYTVQKPQETEPRHLISVVAMGFNGRYNRLFTVTGQCDESAYSANKGTLESVVNSFSPPVATEF